MFLNIFGNNDFLIIDLTILYTFCYKVAYEDPKKDNNYHFPKITCPGVIGAKTSCNFYKKDYFLKRDFTDFVSNVDKISTLLTQPNVKHQK